MSRKSIGSLLALSVLLTALPALAQIEEGAEEVGVEAFELEAPEERENAYEESQSGPETDDVGAIFESSVNVEEIERRTTALESLQQLVAGSSIEDPERPEYMYRLAELYYELARTYETRAFARRDEAFVIRDENPQRAGVLEEMAEADLDQADFYATEAVAIYAEIYQDYGDDYEDIDAVLFYLGANMLQLEMNDDARVIFETLARDYPSSEFLPQALLMLGELDFADGYFDTALEYYLAVAEFPDAVAYPNALYKAAWCIYNLAEGPDDFETSLGLLDETVIASEALGRDRMRRDALRDMALFYSEVYPADAAFAFFEEIAPDMTFDLVARLARIYGDKGSYDDSNTLYRDLIAMNSESYKIVEYQLEIVRNTRPSANEVEIVREVRRLVELMAIAKDGYFADAEQGALEQSDRDLERLLRQLATTYHREAQTTLNEQLFGLAYNLYSDYLALYPDGEYSYVMWFYYADLLRRNEEWLEAAEAYDTALALSTGEGQYDEQALFNACSCYLNMVDVSMAENVTTSEASGTDTGELPPIPEPRPITDEYQSMLTACDRYIETNPAPEDRVQIEFVTAFMYYSFDHLEEAIARFGSISMNNYMVDPMRARVSAELLLESLALLREWEDMKQWLDSYMAMDPLMEDVAFAGRLEGWSEQIDFKLCSDQMDREDYVEAGNCFIAFAESHFGSDLTDKAFYNAALSFEQGNELDFAISAHTFLIEYTPDSDLVPDTIFELGRTYGRMAMYDTSAGYLEDYVQYDGGGEHVNDALIDAARYRKGLGQYSEAIDILRLFIRTTDDEAAEAEAEYQIAQTRELMGDERTAIDEYEAFIDDFEDVLPDRAMEAHTRIAELYYEREYTDRAYEWYETAAEYWRGMPEEMKAEMTPGARDAAATAIFMLGERIFAEFEAIDLDEDSEEAMQEALQEKIEIGARANEIYNEVVQIGRPGMSIAALTRVGRLYHVFYEQIADAPIPGGLTVVQQSAYEEMIGEQRDAQKEIAMGLYADAIMVARDTGYFSEYAEQAASYYQEIDPTFKAGSEITIEPGFDEASYYTAGFITGIEPEVAVMDEEEEEAPAMEDAPSTDDAAPTEGDAAEGDEQAMAP